MVAELLVAGMLVGAPDTSDAFAKIDRWIDTVSAFEEYDRVVERTYQTQQSGQSDVLPTLYESPFYYRDWL